MFILRAVDEGAHTFTDIRKNIWEANTKILSDRLGELVNCGILLKSETGEYNLSKIGSDLSDKLVDISHWWGEKKGI
jgi:DNA-binding HxlR family transcriptional regulator